MLSDVIKKDYLPFPVQHSTASEAPYEVIIRGDTLYLDDDVTWQGLKKLKILARRMIANNKKLTLKAPEVCQSVSGSTCEQLGKAAQATAGRNGRNGIPSTSVEIYVYSIDGNVELISQASNGARGEIGGDGVAGSIGRDATGVPADCSWRCKSRRGYNGGNGGDGSDGQKAGDSGKGGTAKKIILKRARVSGLFKVTKPIAVGGDKAANGDGASGGRGGIGGCGKRCEYSYSSMGNAQSKQCFKHTDCGLRGSTGSTGKHGRNGNDIYGQRNDGINGDDETNDVKTGSMKAWFSGEDDLLELIYRRAEFDFFLNRTDKALEIFDFLMSATDEGSSMHTKASTLKIALENGFDFYGNAKYCAPTKHWDYYSDTSRDLLVSGTAYENAFNTVKEKMDDVKQLSGALKLQMGTGYTDSTRELLSDLNVQTSRKGVYINALTKIEVMMRNQRQEINKLLSEAIVEKNKPKAFNVLDFFDGVTGFAGGFTGKNPWQTYDSAVKVSRV
ncbi:uncharacterized protein LOC143470670 [Clavelina lepadiformis]|uniref:uncharacterized protein LOC143470670 n=1 Tax=Clavelina lepadiformis TaxID=159417 RepID=UPI0040438E1B